MQAKWRFSLSFLSVFPKIFKPFQAGLTAIRISHDSFDHFEQIFPLYATRHHVSRAGNGHPESPSIQHLCVDHHTAGLIMKQLDPVPALVHEDVNITIHRVSAYLVPHQTAQRVEALPHIRRLAVEPVAHPAFQAKHGWMTL